MRTLFDNIDTQTKAYWLGFITADGNTSKNGYTTSVNLSAKDKGHLQKLAQFLNGKVMDVKWIKGDKSYAGCYLHVSDKHMQNMLVSIGVVPNKTEYDQSCILNSVPNDLISHFVRGLFDGDGSICESNETPCFSIAGENRLIDAVKNILVSKIGVSDTKIDTYEHHSVIRWAGRKQCKAIYQWIYKDAETFLERKKLIFIDICNKAKPGSSKYFGVLWYKPKNKWNAYIWSGGKRKHLGYFEKEIDAARARDAAAIELGLPVYKLNFTETI